MSYYAVISPGLEKIARAEMLEKFPELGLQMHHGGIDIDLPLQEGFILNHALKIPTRLLYRLINGKVRDLPKLYKKIKNYDWRDYFIQAPSPVNIHVSAHSSRLFDERKIKQAVIDGMNDFFKGTQPKKSDIDRIAPILKQHSPALYLRFHNDELTVSVDTSGERLDRRGDRTWIGLAPLRETYAHACLYALKKMIGSEECLCDPMSGSGVFAREALDWNSYNRKRNFSYQGFPVTKEVLLPPDQASPWSKIMAIESEGKTFQALKHNLPDSDNVVLKKANALEKMELPADLVMIANPPYGVRLKLDNPVAFLNHVVEKLAQHNPKAIALLMPKEIKINRPHETLLEFSNGGIPVKFIYFDLRR